MKRRNLDINIYLILSSIIVGFIILYFLGFIFIKGGLNISIDFLTESPKGMPIGSEGGILPALIGSLYFGLIALGSSSLLSLSMSIYLSYYCKNNYFKGFMRTIIGIIAGIPSIVLGLFGYSFFVVKLNYGISILSGGLVLGIMIFPYMEVNLEKIFLEVDKNLITASYALGVNRSYTLLKIVIPMTYRQILSTLCLGLSLALSASAPLLITGAVSYTKIPKSVFSPAMALPVHLYYLIGEGVSTKNAYATAFVIIIILLILNSIPFIFSKKHE